MSSSINIPDAYDITLKGGVRITPDPVTILGDPGKPITTLMTGDESKPITATLQGNTLRPLATTIDLLNLPHLSLQDLKDLTTPRLRIQVPNYEKLCVKVLGIELLSLCISGEIQVITQPYKPNPFERCEVECCPEDERPFPANTPIHGAAEGKPK